MKQTKILMGMPVTVEIVDSNASQPALDQVFDYFEYIDQTFSTYKKNSEISLINQGKINKSQYSEDMKTVFSLSEKTKQETDGYFDIFHDEKYDPSGLVKGWAINNAAKLLRELDSKNFYIEAGGDIQTSGKNSQGQNWKVGIRNPFNMEEIVKVLFVKDLGVATSGTYIRGQHIYNPKDKNELSTEVLSLTVVGPNIYEADRFATAAFAMGNKGIGFIENLTGFAGFAIDKNGIATMTSDFEHYTINDA